jgi:hypothetical protein
MLALFEQKKPKGILPQYEYLKKLNKKGSLHTHFWLTDGCAMGGYGEDSGSHIKA